ncbi:hypothetical protein B0920_12270 [Massilia sp. KIM]|uniref:MBL fold metallo-hydrolase n=1 Tax=Massilia sp. KIM TaxID=1955422 RepID=UPI0009D4892C|nr:MBL fold metallo-hydrolase [Massilia sp. KIM]OON64068.1 hypothetical protein B0920_12270 [Massilia sp. KIM]
MTLTLMTPLRRAVLCALLSGLAPAMAQTTAAEPLPAQARTLPGYHRLLLGKFEVTALSDGTVAIPLSELLTGVRPRELDTQLRRAGIDPRQAETSINAFLIHTGGRLVLVDTGGGALFPNSGRLVASLAAAGYRPEQVTDILISHLHPDHSAGLTIDGKAVFAKALVHVHQQDTRFWLEPRNKGAHPEHAHVFDQAARDLAPYQASARVRAFATNAEIVPGVRAVATPGHTPGHSFFRVESEGKVLVLWGDLIHAKDLQFRSPGIAIRYDLDSRAAVAQRKAALREAATEGYLVGAPHLPFPGIGRVLASGGGYEWLPLNYSEAGMGRAQP